MSREIKFRAWDESRKKMHTGNPRYVEFNIGLHGELAASNYSPKQELQKLPIMQYTGLKDVDGADIYEGDVVRLWYAPQAAAIGFISFSNGGFVFNTEKATPNKSFIGECVDCGNSFTVIGNIYQHPELLK